MAPPEKKDRFDGYIPVHERLEKFYQAFPNGRVVTSVVEHDRESGFVLMMAAVYRTGDDAEPSATGHAFEVKGDGFVNRTNHIENAETSCVGRALALLGFEVKRGIASREEMEKTERMAQQSARLEPQPQPRNPRPVDARTVESAADTDEQRPLNEAILKLAAELGYDRAKVDKWASLKFGVAGGLNALDDEQRDIAHKVFTEQAKPKPRAVAS